MVVFDQGSILTAVRTKHAPFTNYLPILKGEALKVIDSDRDGWVKLENKHYVQGLVSIRDVYTQHDYFDEDFFLADFTARMAESYLSTMEFGTFLVRSNSRDTEKLVISAMFSSVTHYSFMKNGNGIEYDGVVYKSIPSFVNKCSQELVLEGYLRNWVKQSDLQIPPVAKDTVSTMQKLNLRIVAGNLAIAIESHISSNSLCLPIQKGRQYRIIRACRNHQYYIVRDDQENEGYVASYMLECYIPDWFHGRIERSDAEQALNKTCRDGTFLVRERPSKPGMFALSVWCPDGVIHVPLVYNNGMITTGVSPELPVFESLLDLVDHYRHETVFWTIKEECVRILFPLSRKESSLPDEIQKMDLKSISLYFKALKEGREHVRDIRLMVVGYYGAGKTTLTERLMGKPFTEVGSTNGIEIHLRQCEFDMKSGRWSNYRPGSAYLDDETHALRLLRVLESPDEERISILDEFKRLASNSSTPTSNRNSTDLSSQNTPMMSPKLHLTSSDRDLESPQFNFNNIAMEDSYEIDVDANDIARYKFSDGTLKVISDTFGKNRTENARRERKGFVSVWDFAGQFIFYSTHQVFLTARAVYLLVLDLSKDLKEFVEDEDFPFESIEMQGHSVKDYGEFWLKSIHTFCGEIPGHPPVILVGTHKDSMKCSESEREEHADKYFEDFRKLIENSPLIDHIQPEQFALDNTMSEESFNKIRKAIVDVAKRQSYWNQEIPARWLSLERSLSKMREIKKIVSLEEVFRVNNQNKVSIEDEDEVVLFLRYQHAIGGLIYFEEEGLNNVVILDPQWIIDAFKSLITATRFCKLHSQLRPLWADLHVKAILQDRLIDEIWKIENNGEFMTEKEKLLLYMEKLDIIAKPTIEREDGSIITANYYFVPSLLRAKENASGFLPFHSVRQCTPWLCFVFDEGFVPPVIFQRMIGACLMQYHVLSVGGVVQLFSQLAIFKIDMCHCFVFRLTDDVMKVQVVNVIEENVKSSDCDKLRRFLTHLLERELGRYQQNVPFTVSIECERQDKTSNEFINCRELLKKGKMPCYAHTDPHPVHAETILMKWFPDYIDIPVGQSTQQSWIDNLSFETKQRIVSLKDLSKISKCLGFNWELLILELGLPQCDIDQAKMDYRYYSAMQIYDCLCKWKKNKAHKATIYSLLKAMCACAAVEVNWDTVKNVADGI